MCIVDLISSSWILCGGGSVGSKTRAGWNANTLIVSEERRFLAAATASNFGPNSSWAVETSGLGLDAIVTKPSSNMKNTNWWRFETGNLKLKINIGFSKDTQLLSRMQTNTFRLSNERIGVKHGAHQACKRRCSGATVARPMILLALLIPKTFQDYVTISFHSSTCLSIYPQIFCTHIICMHR